MSFERITRPADADPPLVPTNITPLDDRPALTAAALKAKFDEAGVDIVEFLSGMADEINGLIGALEYQTGAGNIGAAPLWDGEDSENNVQAKLAALKTYMDGLTIAVGAGDMLKSVFAKLEPQNKKVDHAVDSDKLSGQAATAFAKSIAAQSVKETLADNDAFPMADSADSNVQKKTLWSTIKTAFQTAFTETFSAKTHNHGNISNNGGFTIEPLDAGTCFVAWEIDNKIHLKAAGAGRTAFGIMPNNANQEDFEEGDAVDEADVLPVYDISSEKQKKAPISTILAGTVKNADGIRVSVQSSAPTDPAVNDLWFSDET